MGRHSASAFTLPPAMHYRTAAGVLVIWDGQAWQKVTPRQPARRRSRTHRVTRAVVLTLATAIGGVALGLLSAVVSLLTLWGAAVAFSGLL